MRWGRGVLLGLLGGLLVIGLGYRSGRFPQLTTTINQVRNQVSGAMTPQGQVVTHAHSFKVPKNATPVENIVRGVSLDKTYHYQFSDQLNANGKQVFSDAVDVYNQTGVVHLVAGGNWGAAIRLPFPFTINTCPVNQNSLSWDMVAQKLFRQQPIGAPRVSIMRKPASMVIIHRRTVMRLPSMNSATPWASITVNPDYRLCIRSRMGKPSYQTGMSPV